MAPPPKNQAEIDARNQYESFTRGWLHGARGVEPAAEFLGHENQLIRDAYTLGRCDGGLAHAKACFAAAERYGIDLDTAVLR